MNTFEKELKKRILEETHGRPEDYTPSLDIEVYHRGRRRAKIHLGEPAKYYDLASLTKPLFTVSAFMRLVDERKINLGDSIQHYLPWWPHPKTTVAQVLSHAAGLTWWAPFYKMIPKKASPKRAREVVRKYLAKLKLEKSKKAVYSDLDFLLLGFLLEAVTGKDLAQVWRDLNKKMKLSSIHFAENNRPPHPRREYAPTEKCPWRHKTLRGEVHDDNTWALGGVSSHAGLFGNIKDVSKWGLLLRKAYLQKSGSALASQATARLFAQRAVPMSGGDWAMGLMMPSCKGSTAGKYFSSKSVGHTGFTGTSIWFDPKKDLLVVILSNRVHPTRENMKFRELRPRIHDFVVESL